MNSFFSQPNAFAQPFQALSPEEEALQRQAMAQRNEQPFTRAQVNQAVAPGGQLPGAPQMPPGPGGGQMPPGLGLTQPMPGGAPGGGGLPGQQGVRDFLGSPGAAMMSAALGNLGRSGPGHPQGGQRVDPIQAYQQGVQRQALLKQQENAAKLREAQAERLRAKDARDANPMHDFEYFVDKMGLQNEAYETQIAAYDQFQRAGLKGQSDTSQMKNLAMRKRMQDSIAAGDGQYTQADLDAFNEDVRKTQWLNTGGAYINPGQPGSGPSTIPIDVKPGERLDYLAERDTNKIMNESLAQNNAEILRAIGTPYDEATTMLQNTRDLREQIESGQFQRTGVFEGPWAKMMGDPEAARLQAKSIGQALKNLQITNLAPVTEAEIALIQELFAGISSDPAQNVEILKEAEKMLQQKLEQTDKLATYYANNNNSLEGYGMERYRKAEPATGDMVINLVLRDGKLVPE